MTQFQSLKGYFDVNLIQNSKTINCTFKGKNIFVTQG